ncbi:MAG: N-acetylmuramoyl-L-alanine amidase [Bacteroidetes bacterium]|nr:N-acetylmuramoyl-L-alanine amidase [Bacteroidota bacterium]
MIKDNRFNPKGFFKTIVLLLSLLSPALTQAAGFTVVIDAGHGGHDPGAIGTYAREKDINLAVSLEIGNLIEKNFDDVKVVYTRKTDKYLTLQERADIVNNNHADLFLCIHTNSSKSTSAYGAETFTLGLAKSKSNLDVAMRENSVILLEDDYKTKYRGFDPGSVDSYIMFEFMQDKYLDRSIDIASSIQKQFVRYAGRSDRGVRQAGFWVLHRSACPSVLVELGFISNPAEERYLASDNGKKEMAAAIYNAFVNFKKEHDKKSGKPSSNQKYNELPKLSDNSKSSEVVDIKVDDRVDLKAVSQDSALPETIQPYPSTEVKQSVSADLPVFKVQVLASPVKLKPGAAELKGIKEMNFFVENGLYKYTVGAESDYQKIKKIRKDLQTKFPGAFIIGFVGERKLTNTEIQKFIK